MERKLHLGLGLCVLYAIDTNTANKHGKERVNIIPHPTSFAATQITPSLLESGVKKSFPAFDEIG